MGYWRSTGFGEYVAGEAHDAMLPKRTSGLSSQRPIILLHGSGGDAYGYLGADPECKLMAANGLPIFSADLGGETWGNDLVQSRIDTYWAFIKARWPVKADKMNLYGISAGGPGALTYARNNPSKVGAVGTLMSAIDIEDIRFNDRTGVGLKAKIEGAYTNLAGWNTAKATHNPSDNAAAHASQAPVIKQWVGNSDLICIYSIAQAFATAAGSTLVTMAGQGHNFPPVGLAAADVMSFFQAHA